PGRRRDCGAGEGSSARAGVLLPLVGVGDGVTVVVVARDRDREGVVGLGGSLVDRGRVHDRSGVGDRDLPGGELRAVDGPVVGGDEHPDLVALVPVAGRGQVQGRAGGPGDVGKARAGVLLPLVGVGDGVTVVVVARDRDREGVVGLGGSLVDRGRVHDRRGVRGGDVHGGERRGARGRRGGSR